MEEGAHVWLKSPKSEWGWLPARIKRKEIVPKPQNYKNQQAAAARNAARGARNGGSSKPTSNGSASNANGGNNSGGGGGGIDRKAALLKQLDDARRKELQTIMRDRSLAKDVRKQRMDEVKDRYAQLVQDAENSPTPPPEANNDPAMNGAGSGADQPPEEEEEVALEDTMIELTLVDDFTGLEESSNVQDTLSNTSGYGRGVSGYYANMASFKEIIHIDSINARDEHPDIKLRNMPTSCSASSIQFYGESNAMNKNVASTRNLKHMPDPAVGQPKTKINDSITGGVDDLIGLTHLHEPAILHALRLRYNTDIIYTSTGPILLAINPFKVSFVVVVVDSGCFCVALGGRTEFGGYWRLPLGLVQSTSSLLHFFGTRLFFTFI